MWIDVALGVLLVVFLLMGFAKGFMCGILGFVSSGISFAAAVFSAKPVAKIMDQWIDLAAKCENIMHGLGRPLSILLCGICVFLFCKFLFFIVGRTIRKFKSEHRAVDGIDKVAGIFLGFCKYCLLLCVIFTVVHLIDIIPLIGKLVDWLFKDSKVGKVIYQSIYNEHVWPLIEKMLPWKKG